mgnify:CR=1 FL=1
MGKLVFLQNSELGGAGGAVFLDFGSCGFDGFFVDEGSGGGLGEGFERLFDDAVLDGVEGDDGDAAAGFHRHFF